MIAPRVDAHIGLGRHMAVDALRAGGAYGVKMVVGCIVRLRSQGGEAVVGLTLVALHTQCSALGPELERVWLMAIGAAHPGVVHLALHIGAVDIHFI